jgi:hypothetical protein
VKLVMGSDKFAALWHFALKITNAKHSPSLSEVYRINIPDYTGLPKSQSGAFFCAARLISNQRLGDTHMLAFVVEPNYVGAERIAWRSMRMRGSLDVRVKFGRLLTNEDIGREVEVLGHFPRTNNGYYYFRDEDVEEHYAKFEATRPRGMFA